MSSKKMTETPNKTSPGAMLKRAREKAGMSLQHISDQTLIPVARLAALEADDFERVGGVAYVVGYARNAIQTIGADPAPIIDAFGTLLSSNEAAGKISESVPTSAPAAGQPKQVKLLIMGVGIALILVFIYLIVLLFGGSGVSSSQLPANQSKPALSATVSSQDGVQNLDDQESVMSESVMSEADLVLVEEAVSGTDTSSIEPEVVATSEEYEYEPEDLEDLGVELSQDGEVLNVAEELDVELEANLDLFFSEECWVQVTDSSGKRLVARVANAGDHIAVTGIAPFDVMLGNSRGATIEYNGEAVSITPKQGKRTLRLSVGD